MPGKAIGPVRNTPSVKDPFAITPGTRSLPGNIRPAVPVIPSSPGAGPVNPADKIAAVKASNRPSSAPTVGQNVPSRSAIGRRLKKPAIR